MKNLTLILKFRLAEDAELQVKDATRITIDGSGNLLVHSDDCAPERISLSGVHSLGIQAMCVSSRPAPAAEAA